MHVPGSRSRASTSAARGRSPCRQSAGRATANRCTIVGARENNLKNVTVNIPLGTLTCVTGVSGSGKSSLVNEILYKKLSARAQRRADRAGRAPGDSRASRISTRSSHRPDRRSAARRARTRRPIPACSPISATLFANVPEAKMRGFGPGRFSFNIKGGRCEACQGDGIIKIEMHFLPDVYVPCDVCKGKRYNRETLEVHYKGKSIYDVLEMTVEEALEFFKDLPRIERKLRNAVRRRPRLHQARPALHDALRRRGAAREARDRAEPQADRQDGLHSRRADDRPAHRATCHRLIDVLQKLVDAGNTVIVIEHNLDVIKTRRPHHRPRPRGRRRGRHGRRRGHAGAGRRDARLLHGRVYPDDARARQKAQGTRPLTAPRRGATINPCRKAQNETGDVKQMVTLPPKRKICSVQFHPMKHCAELNV